MYEVELSEAADDDLNDFSDAEIQEIFAVLLSLEDNPKPTRVQVIPMEEAADRIAYLYETDTYSLFYNIFEIARLLKVVAIFKKSI